MDTPVQAIDKTTDPMQMGNSHFEEYCSRQVRDLNPKIKKALVLNLAAISLGHDLFRKLDTTELEPQEERELKVFWQEFVMGTMKDRCSRTGDFSIRDFRFLLANLCAPWMQGLWSDIYSQQRATEKNKYSLPA